MTKHNGHLSTNPAEDYNYADGRLEHTPSADDSEFISTLQSRFDLKPDKAVEIYSEVWEHISENLPKRVAKKGDNVTALDKTFRRGIMICAGGRTCKQVAFMFGCLAVELGMGEYWGVQNAAELAKRFRLTKADATNYVTRFRAALKEGAGELPPIPGQRTKEQRNGFRKLRRAQEDNRPRSVVVKEIVERNGGTINESETK